MQGGGQGCRWWSTGRFMRCQQGAAHPGGSLWPVGFAGHRLKPAVETCAQHRAAWQNLGKVRGIISGTHAHANADHTELLLQMSLHGAMLKSTGRKREGPEAGSSISGRRFLETAAVADRLASLLAPLAPKRTSCCRQDDMGIPSHRSISIFSKWTQGTTCDTLSAVEASCKLYLHIISFCYAFHLPSIIQYAFFIVSCVIFLQYRQRNSHLLSLSFSRRFFVSSYFCCLSLEFFSPSLYCFLTQGNQNWSQFMVTSSLKQWL